MQFDARNLENIISSGILWGLDQLGRPAVLLNGSGKVVEVNECAERLLGNGVAIVKGQLSATSRDADPEFQELLKRALGIWREEMSGAIALPRPSRRPLIARAAPIVKSTGGVVQRAKALVMFVDPEQKKRTTTSLLQRAFGLTPAEARIALSIASGEKLRHAAKLNGIAFETARVHLKTIFAKTQTRRQVELALLINCLSI
jgi:DNA-binding CsgD family transcriptional regulator